MLEEVQHCRRHAAHIAAHERRCGPHGPQDEVAAQLRVRKPGRPTSGTPRPLISVIHANAATWSPMMSLGEHQSYVRQPGPEAANWRVSCACPGCVGRRVGGGVRRARRVHRHRADAGLPFRAVQLAAEGSDSHAGPEPPQLSSRPAVTHPWSGLLSPPMRRLPRRSYPRPGLRLRLRLRLCRTPWPGRSQAASARHRQVGTTASSVCGTAVIEAPREPTGLGSRPPPRAT